MLDFEFLKQSASVLADAAVKTTKDLTDKGKHKMDVLAAERHLAKTQRQLGALVYSLYKNGQTNDQLVKKYLQAVEQAEGQLEKRLRKAAMCAWRKSACAAARRLARMPPFVLAAGRSLNRPMIRAVVFGTQKNDANDSPES